MEYNVNIDTDISVSQADHEYMSMIVLDNTQIPRGVTKIEIQTIMNIYVSRNERHTIKGRSVHKASTPLFAGTSGLLFFSVVTLVSMIIAGKTKCYKTYGSHVNSTEPDGSQVNCSGPDGSHASSTENDGSQVNSTELDGSHVNSTEPDGSQVNSKEPGGYQVNSTEPGGSFTNSTEPDGSHVNSTEPDSSPLSDKCPKELPVEWQNCCYGLFVKTISYFEAQRHCHTLVSDLVWIMGSQEQEFIKYFRKCSCGMWIGCMGPSKNGKYIWVHNYQNVTYSNWGDGQPDNHNNREYCCMMRNDGTWNDIDCLGTYYRMTRYTCKKSKEPVDDRP